MPEDLTCITCQHYTPDSTNTFVNGTNVQLASLRLLHFESCPTQSGADPKFCDVTIPPLPPNGNNEVCGAVSSLSPFVVAALKNRSPDCSGAAVSAATLWPADHGYANETITGVTDPDGDPVTIAVTGIAQDEPLVSNGSGRFCPDATGVGTSTASVRAERDGSGDGRVYHVSFSASDGRGGQCAGTVTVCVPHDRFAGHVCVDQGAVVNSTGPCPAGSHDRHRRHHARR